MRVVRDTRSGCRVITIRDSIYFPDKVRYIEINGNRIGTILTEEHGYRACFGMNKSPERYSTFDEALNAIKVHAVAMKLETS